MVWRRAFASLSKVGIRPRLWEVSHFVSFQPFRALGYDSACTQRAGATLQPSTLAASSKAHIHYGVWGAAATLLGVGICTDHSLVSLAQKEDCQPTAKDQQRVEVEDPYFVPSNLVPLPKSVIVYQYEVCPFCCKLKAFLDYNKIPYQTVEVNPISKSQLKWSAYKKVPVVMLDSDAMADSSAIISHLQAALQQKHAPQHPPQKKGWFSVFGGGKAPDQSPGEVQTDEERRWRKWVDDRLVKVLTVNIYRTPRESFQTFDYITDTGKFNVFEREAARIVGATTMYAISGKLKKKYNISGEPRAELYSTAEEWVSGLEGRPFMGGDVPDLADISAFGVIRSITCTDTFLDLMHNTKISGWYERMIKAVGDSSRIGAT